MAEATPTAEVSPDVAAMTAMITEVARQAATGVLKEAGAGEVNRSDLAVTQADATRAETEDLSEHQTRMRKLGDDLGYETREYPRIAIVDAWDTHPRMRACSSEAQRVEIRTAERMDYDWRLATINKDRARANQIACYSRQLITDAASGGPLIPQNLETRIIEKRELIDKITPRSMQSIATNGNVTIPQEAVVLAAAQTAEDGVIPSTDITFTGVDVVLKKTTARGAVSREMMEDIAAGISVTEILSSQAARAFAKTNNVQSMTGDGTGENWQDGILNNASIATATGGVFTRAMALALYYTIGDAFRQEGLWWLVNSTLLQIISQLPAHSGGPPLYPNILGGGASMPLTEGGGPAGLVEGIPVLELPDEANTGDILVLANLTGFSAVIQPGIRVESTTEGGVAWAQDLVDFKFVNRQNGVVNQPLMFSKTDAAVTLV